MDASTDLPACRAAPYRYTPLPGPRCIRVLKLSPSRSRNEPIHCSFQQIDLAAEDHCEYEAVSYTWGALRGSKPILCDGGTILVTPNCEQALLHLRYKFRPRILWIDAICISQDSTQEKNEQVAIMGDIYHHAIGTILWLGTGTAELRATLRHAARYGDYYNRAHEKYKAAKRKFRAQKEEPIVYNEYWQWPVLSIAESQRIADLCCNEWFQRMWTLQDFWLSKSASFMMGSVTCSSDALFTYYSFGKKLVLRPDLEHFRLRQSMKVKPFNDNERSFFADLVHLTALNKTTEPRDKVYGMIAFIKHRCPTFDLGIVDYAKSVSWVYEEFTWFLMLATKSLWHLELATGRSSSSDPLPSWLVNLQNAELAPDWGEWMSRRPSLERSEFQAPNDGDLAGQLSVVAKHVGQVLSVGSRMPSWKPEAQTISPVVMDAQRSMCLSEWTAFATELDIQGGSEHEKHYLQKLEKLTSSLDYLRDRHILEDEVNAGFGYSTPEKAAKERSKQAKAVRKQAAKSPSFWNHEAKAHDMCVLFLTSGDLLGESPGDVCVGDDIFIIQGSIYPFVLRKDGNHFRVVGKAYFDKMHHESGWRPASLGEDADVEVITLI